MYKYIGREYMYIWSMDGQRVEQMNKWMVVEYIDAQNGWIDGQQDG